MNRTLTCIICPLGCTLSVEFDGKTVNSVTGNTCPRGLAYAKSECTAPMRTLTTTVRCGDGSLVSVKTKQPIPKERLMDAMAVLNDLVAPLPISIGDVLLDDLFGSPVVACANKE